MFIIVYVCIFVDLEYVSVLFMLWILVWHKCVTWRWQGAVLLLFVAHFRCHQILTVLTDCRCRFMQKTKLTQIDACRCFELPFVCPILKVCPILNSGLLELMHKGQKNPLFWNHCIGQIGSGLTFNSECLSKAKWGQIHS